VLKSLQDHSIIAKIKKIKKGKQEKEMEKWKHIECHKLFLKSFVM